MACFTIQHSNKFSKLSHIDKIIFYDYQGQMMGFYRGPFQSDRLHAVINLLPHHLSYQHIQA